MLLAFLTLAIVPIIVAVATKIIAHRNIHWSEFVGTLVIGFAVNMLGLAIDRAARVGDTSVVTGTVTSKERRTESCSHRYSCRCRTVNKRRHCDTCYRHLFDYSWYVLADVGQVRISRVDGQGRIQPPRWAEATVGEPFTVTKQFDNWVQAAPQSLFGSYLGETEFHMDLPAEPSVFDYYRYKPAVADSAQDLSALNTALLDIQRGKSYSVSLLVIGADSKAGPEVEALRLGGANNEVSIVIGSSAWPKIDWSHVYTYGRSRGNARLSQELSSALVKLGSMDDASALARVVDSAIDKHYRPTLLKDFAYLASEIRPSLAAIVVTILLNLVITGFISWRFSNNNLNSGDSLK